MYKRISCILVLVSLCLVVFSSCDKKDEDNSGSGDIKGHPKVKIEVKGKGTMTLELYPEYAPETVKNFIKLVEKDFYKGLTFHRIIEGFMIQGGDPSGDGTGGSGETIPGEFPSNNFTKNTLKHTRGVLSMARKGDDPNSATSQFFIMLKDNDFLDGDYAAFGKLIKGEDVLDKIGNVAVKPNQSGKMEVPKEKVVIKNITLVDK